MNSHSTRLSTVMSYWEHDTSTLPCFPPLQSPDAPAYLHLIFITFGLPFFGFFAWPTVTDVLPVSSTSICLLSIWCGVIVSMSNTFFITYCTIFWTLLMVILLLKLLSAAQTHKKTLIPEGHRKWVSRNVSNHTILPHITVESCDTICITANQSTAQNSKTYLWLS